MLTLLLRLSLAVFQIRIGRKSTIILCLFGNAVGLFSTYVGLCVVVGFAFVYSWVIKRVSVQKAFSFSLVTMATAMLAVLIPSATLQWLLAMPLGIADAVAYGSGLTQLSNCFPTDRQG